jgi:cytochrome c
MFFLAMLAGCEFATGPEVSTPAPSVVDRRGELLSLACQACHSLDSTGSHQVGPNLFAVFGRVAGTNQGFDYSTALRDSRIVWSPVELDGWLADPTGFLPGTTMAFTGYQQADDRAALIQFLVTATASSADPPGR